MPHADLSDPGPKHLSGASARPVPQAYQYLYVPPAARANVTSKAPLRLCRPSARDLHLGRSSDLSDPGPQHLSRTSTARAPTIPAKLLSVSAGPVPEISTSGEVTDRKSRFVGHAAKVGSLGEVRAFVDGVLDDKRVRRATHPAILAWRVEGESGKSIRRGLHHYLGWPRTRLRLQGRAIATGVRNGHGECNWAIARQAVRTGHRGRAGMWCRSNENEERSPRERSDEERRADMQGTTTAARPQLGATSLLSSRRWTCKAPWP